MSTFYYFDNLVTNWESNKQSSALWIVSKCDKRVLIDWVKFYFSKKNLIPTLKTDFFRKKGLMTFIKCLLILN